MRVLGYIGMLAVAAILLVMMVTVGKGLTAGEAKSGEQKAVQEMKKDKDAPIDDPKDEIRGAISDAYGNK